jgi:TonB family protein
MKKRIYVSIMVCAGAICIQAQTVTLPTKTTPKTSVTQEAGKLTQEETSQSGTITLPTTKNVNTDERATETSPVTQVIVAGDNNVLLLPVVVRRQTAPRAKPIIKRPKKEDNEIYESAEHMPTYPGGVDALKKFIDEHMHYPQEALADGVEGIVQVSFIVEKDGSTTDFEVLDEHHPALEAEAVRILQQMPKWNPAKQNGVKVRVEYVVPVKFNLSNQ